MNGNLNLRGPNKSVYFVLKLNSSIQLHFYSFKHDMQ